jgi:hypothetical protein
LDLEQNDLSKQVFINQRLNPETRKSIEMQLKPEELPRYDHMITFLQNWCHVLEGLERSEQPTSSTPKQLPHKSASQLQKSFQGKINALLNGISHKTSMIRYKITVQIQSKRLEFLILPKITGNIPLALLDTKAWTIPTDKPLWLDEWHTLYQFFENV